MSLDSDYSKCDVRCREPEHWKLTESLIWSSMIVGLGSLTEKNVHEWRVRLGMWAETVKGESYATLRDMPEAEWRMRYGLSTNVTNETRAQFRRRFTRIVEQDADRAARAVENVNLKIKAEVRP